MEIVGGEAEREVGRGNAADGMMTEGSKTHLCGDHRGPLLYATHGLPKSGRCAWSIKN
jgi:hypothetical protein